MLKRRLFTPGPVPVPDRVRLAMARPIVHHRAADFQPLFERCRERLRRVFQTDRQVVIFASSGTGAMEAAVTNFVSPGDHVLVVRGGKFGERWAEIAAAFGVRTTCIDVEWGRAVRPEQVEEALAAHPEISAVFFQASETSTGVRHPTRELAEIAHRGGDRLVVVDGITAVGVYDLPMDAWGLDVVVSGSQKAFMLPPGLAFLALSERAERFRARARCPRYYFDLEAELAAQPRNQTAWTPAVSLLFGLDEALTILLEEQGLEATWARTERIAAATREAMRAIGLELLAPDAPSPACTAVRLPAGVDDGKFRGYLRERLGVWVAGGQARLKGKIFRIAHLGYYDRLDAIAAVAAVEIALRALGHAVEPGAGLRAAIERLGD